MSVAAAGRLLWIGLAPSRGAARVAVSEARAEADVGMIGDWHAKERPGGSRQVTLMSAEALAAVAAQLGRPVPPELVLRNLLMQGADLDALRGHRFRIGRVLLEGTGECAPCTKMASSFGSGALEAFAGRGGLCARILEGGVLRVGDALRVEPAAPAAPAE